MPQIYKIIMTNKSFGSQKGKKVLTSGIFKNVWIFQNAYLFRQMPWSENDSNSSLPSSIFCVSLVAAMTKTGNGKLDVGKMMMKVKY